MSRQKWFRIEPPVVGNGTVPKAFADFAKDLCARLDAESERDESIEECRRRGVRGVSRKAGKARQSVVSAMHVLADLAKQGWRVRVKRSRVEVARQNGVADSDDPRERIRSQLHAERDQQLRQRPVQEFVRSMEVRRFFGGQHVSIFSLMRDGEDLARQLRAMRAELDPLRLPLGKGESGEAGALAHASGYKGEAASSVAPPSPALPPRGGEGEVRDPAALLSRVVRPYLQFVDEEATCGFTGLRLMDIWRYFRHTWANPYKSVPGRTMLILVRDAAAPCHPVIGLAALSSAAVATTARDEWIGWTPKHVLKMIEDAPSAKLAGWLKRIVDEGIEEIYTVDLEADNLLSASKVKSPTAAVVEQLEAEGAKCRRSHHANMQAGEYKQSEPANDGQDEHWVRQAETPLFRSKRCLELAQLLSLRKLLAERFAGKGSRVGIQGSGRGRRKEAVRGVASSVAPPSPALPPRGGEGEGALAYASDYKATKAGLKRLVADGVGKDAVGKIVRRAKASRVGTLIADLTVCGAVPPYGELLGGKLVAGLMASPEVVREYRRRYGGVASVIASSMAGKRVVRPAELALIGTTSLYGQRPCQYDRIAVPFGGATRVADASSVGHEVTMRWEYLGRTLGMGTFQFGDETVRELSVLLAQSNRGQTVNSVFGEGVNPRLRKIRDGLRELGLPEDELLNHGAPRLVYGMALVSNVREYLLGLEGKPRYLVRGSGKNPLRLPLGKGESQTETGEIVGWWLRRWVVGRVGRDDVLERMAGHRLVHPITHGGRVVLPRGSGGQREFWE